MRRSRLRRAALAMMAGRRAFLRSLLLAPLCEGLLILLAALAAFWTRQPLLFASLGPTAFELIEAPKRRSARAWNVIAGHLIGILSGLRLWR